MYARIALPTCLGIAALATAVVLATRNVDAAPQAEKATKDAVTMRFEAFLSNLGDTTKRTDLISKMCEGGPIQGLMPNQQRISALADAVVKEFGLPMTGADSVVLAEEKNVSTFFTARTYVVRCEQGPSVWHVLFYSGSKGWGISELGISPNAHCLIPTWRDFPMIQQQQPKAANPAPAGANR
ncbi:MAG: hypothetical protein ACKVS6_07705 [Planctomycetota bacterium]